jgi:ankyrin repeat protein
VNYGYTDVVREFVAHGARGDVRSVYQETPLLTATYYRRSDIIELIARGGWDVNVKDKDGLTPLVWAARFGLLPELKQLLGLGAQVNVHSRYGFTPLIVAASMGNTPEALQLLKSGADPALRDAFGQTALHQAAYLGSREIVRALLAEPRTDVSAVNALRLTPLDYAWANSHHEVARALIAAGASLTVKDPHGHGQAFRLLLNGFPAEELRRKLGEGPPFSADECRMLGRGLWCP